MGVRSISTSQVALCTRELRGVIAALLVICAHVFAANEARASLFSDDFTRTNDPGSLSPWTAQSGNWTITGGILQSGPNTLQSYGTVYYSDIWSNYAVEARIQFPAGAYGGGVGARLNSATGARYAAWVYPEGSPGGSNVLKLIKFQSWTAFSYNGFSGITMQQAALPGVGANWHTVKLALDGNQISVFYDGNQMISASDAEAQPLTSGGVTLEMWTDNSAYVMNADDVVVSGPAAAQTITFNAPANPTYGDAAFPLAAQASSGLPVAYRVLSGPATVIGTNILVTAVGNVTVRASQSGDDNFEAASAVDASFTVNPAVITVTAADKLKVYGAALPALTSSYSGFVNGETSSVVSGAPALGTSALASSPVGDYPITAALGSLTATNYTFAFINGQLTVTPATLTVAGDNLSRPFGVTNPPFTATFSGFVNSDGPGVVSGAPSFACSAATNSMPGVYPISVGTGSLAASNYNLVTVDATLTVLSTRRAFYDDFTRDNDPAPITPWIAQAGNWSVTAGAMVATNATFNYGFAYLTNDWSDFSVAARIRFPSGAFGGGIGGRLNPATGTHYAAWVYPEGSIGGSKVLKLIKFQNWTAFGYNGTYLAPIQQVALTSVGTNWHSVQLSFQGDQIKVYFDSNLMITATDTEAVTYTNGGVSLDFWTDAAPYMMTADDVTVTTPVTTQSITFDPLPDNTYGASFDLTASASSGLPLSYSVVSGPAVIVGSNLTLTGVGSVTVRASQSGDSAYFAAPDVDRTFTVNPALLTVSADAVTKPYGTADPTLTWQITSGALVGADTLVGGLTRVPGENLGSYSINQGTLTAGTNYNLSYNSANLTIVPALVTVTADPKTKTYGTADPVFTYQITSGALVGGDTFSGALSRGAGETVGVYAINQGSLTAGTNYALSFNTENLTISPAPLTVTADSRSKVYGSADPALTYKITSGALVGGDTLSGTLSRIAGENVGTYGIQQGTLAASANYTLAFNPADLTIGAAPLTVTADPRTKVYGAADPALTYQITSGALVGSDTLSGSLTRAAGETVGTYTINQGTLAGGTNYALSFNTANLTITAAPLTVTADSKTKVYGTTDPALTYQITGGALIGSDGLSGALIRSSGETVGAYAIQQGTLTAGTNYAISFNSANLTVTTALLTVSADPKTKVYGASDPALTYQITSGALVGGDGFAGSLSRVAGQTIGNYAINQGTLTAGTNYSLSFNPANLTITPALLTVAADGKTKVYGASDPALTYHITLGALVGADSFSGTLSRVGGETVGTYAINQGTLTLGTNYALSFISSNLTITAAPLTVTADTKSKVYGSADPALTYHISSGVLVGSDTMSGSLSRVAGETVGPYAINQGSLSAGTNYALSFNAANLTISQAPLTVSADAKSKVYGSADPAFTYHISSGSLVGSDSLSGTLSRAVGETVGSYTINQGTLTAGTNYALSFNSANLTITAAPLTIAADPNAKAYGASDPAFTYQITNGALIGSDSLVGALTRVAGETVGSYAIQQGTLTAGTNYSLTFNSANLTITATALTVTADPKAKVYGASDPALTYQITSGALVAGDSFSGALTRVAGETVGSYAINRGTLSAGTNYTLSFNSANLQITPRALLARADGLTRLYGAANPPFTISYSGFVGSDTVSNLAVLPVASSSAQSNSPIGAYDITLTGGSDTNYSLVLSNGTLTVTPANLSITADPKTKTYGAADPALTYQITGGTLFGSDTLSGSVSRDAGENVASYAIKQGTLSAGTNYAISFTPASLAITPRALSVTADPRTKVYGAADPILTYQITSGSLVGSDTFSGMLGRTVGETVGVYAINQGTLSLGPNYSLSVSSANLTITPRPLTVSADPKSKSYGAADPALTFQITSGSLVGGDLVNGSLVRVAGETIGSYAINQGALAAGTNYALSFNSANLTITPRILVVAADPKSKVYGTIDPNYTYHITTGGLVGGDTLTGSMARLVGETTGTYLITQGTISATTNYSLSFTTSYLTINPAPLTVTADPKTKVYGSADPALTYHLASGTLIGTDTLSGSLSRVAGETVGAYSITLGTVTAGTNYTISLNAANLTIAPAALTVTANAKSKAYGTGDPALTWQLTSGALIGGDSFSGSLSRAAGETVGTYAIQQGTLTAGTNYTLTLNSANLTITPAPLTVTADAKTKVYGAADPAFTYQLTSGALVGSDSFSGTLSRAAGEPVGTYAINQGTLTAGTNYTLSFNSANLTITPRALLAQADNKNRIYGTTNPIFTISYSGFVGSDSVTNLAVLPIASTPAQTNSPIGAYNITLSGGSDTNYSFVLSNGTLTVTAAALTVAADPKSKVYGAADPALTYQITNGALLFGDTITGSLSRVAGQTVGNYAIQQGTLSAGTNYTLTFSPANLTITPALLSVTADSKTKVYGAVDPALTWQITSGALVGSDSLGGALTRAIGETSGSYAIQQGTLSAGTNYTLTFNPANLTITPAALSVAADARTKVYGAADPALTWQIKSGALVGTDSLSGSLSRVAGQTVGSYPIQQGTLNAGTNYALTFIGTNLTILPAPLTIAADAKTKVYGDGDPALTYHLTSGALVGTDSLSGSLSRVAGENVGSYPINQGTLTAGTNYALTYNSASFAITARALLAKADSKSRIYGAANPVFTISYSGFVGSDTVTNLAVLPMASTAAQTNSPIGAYDITLSGGSDTNYSFILSNGTLTVTAAALVVTADPRTKIYGSDDPALTYQITAGALMPGDFFTGSLTRVAGEAVGSYAINQGTLAASTNYTLTFNPAIFAITPASLAISADPQTKVYGSVDPALTYHIASGSLVGGDTLSGALTRVPGETVGNYIISRGTLTAGTNYNLTCNSANLLINPAPLTVGADAKSKVYGDADPALTYYITGGALVGSDSLNGSLSRAVGENVGSYAINQGTLTAGTNYALTYNSANLSITPRALLAHADNQSRAYGTANPVFTISYSGFVGADAITNLAVLPVAGTLAQINSPIGAYDITLSGGSATNYSFVLSNGTLTVTAAALTVTADPKSKVYGAADPALTYTITSGALLNGESLSGSLARVPGETVGNYPINQGTLAATTNYTLAFNSANLTITAAQSTNTLTSSQNPSVQGSNVTFTATLGPVAPAITIPTGNVQFLTNGVPFGSPVALIGGVASINTAFLPAGSNIITAAYPGDANFRGSTNALTQNVTPISQRPQTLGLKNNGNGTITVTFAGTPGVQYVVQATASLSPASWVDISTNTAGPDGLWTITDSITNHPQRFYRSAKFPATTTLVPGRPSTLGLKDNLDGTVTASFAGMAGAQYVVQATDSLVTPITWVNLSTNTAAPDGHWKYTESTAGRPKRFYRAAYITNALQNGVTIQPPQDAGIHNNGDGTLTISFRGTPGAQYLIQATSTLNLPLVWTTISTNTASASGLYSYTDSISNFMLRYYRSVIP
jgi:hypothetical protein